MAGNIPIKAETLEIKDFSQLFGRLDGLSEDMLKQHNKLYEGYVAKYNEISEKLKNVDKMSANHNYSEYRSMKIEITHNFNAVMFHEMYFSNLTANYEEPSQELGNIISNYYGSWDNYISDLKAAGMASRAGWAATVYNYRDGKLCNCVIDQHNIDVPAGVRFVLLLDAWEHAYTLDYGTDKKSYINNFLDNVNWKVVENRINCAFKSSEILAKATE